MQVSGQLSTHILCTRLPRAACSKAGTKGDRG
jgi:hypothetical protein